MAALVILIGFDELVLAVGLVLITVSLWPMLERLALIVPGVVFVWLALPARKPFVAKPADEMKRRAR